MCKMSLSAEHDLTVSPIAYCVNDSEQRENWLIIFSTCGDWDEDKDYGHGVGREQVPAPTRETL